MTESEWLISQVRHYLPRPSARKMRLFACACCRQVWHLLTDDVPCPGHSGLECCQTTLCPICDGSGRLNRSRRAVEVAERYADGQATGAELRLARNDARLLVLQGADAAPTLAFACTLSDATDSIADFPDATGLIPSAAQTALLRCIFGNPWGPARLMPEEPANAFAALDVLDREAKNPPRVYFDRRWITPTVTALARAIYEDRRWEELPVMADALGEAGCTDEALLGHLRETELPCESCRGEGLRDISVADRWGNPRWDYGHCPDCKGTGRLPVLHARGCHVVDLVLGKE